MDLYPIYPMCRNGFEKMIEESALLSSDFCEEVFVGSVSVSQVYVKATLLHLYRMSTWY